jgi:hypothetical protein
VGCYNEAPRLKQGTMRWFQVAAADFEALMLRVKGLEDDLALLRAQHERLRGRFYATKGQDSPPRELTKAEILRAAGYVPGRNFSHPGGSSS